MTTKLLLMRRLAMGAVTAGLLFPVLVQAQQLSRQKDEAPNYFVRNFTWMTAPWTDDDKRFIAIETGINRLQQRGVNLKSKLPTYRVEAIENMARPEKPYRWAYASSKVIKPLDFAIGAIPIDSPLLKDGLFEVLMRPAAPDERYYFDDPNFKRLYGTTTRKTGPMGVPVKLPPPVRSYRYSRMLFLVGSIRYRLQDVPSLRALGERLLQRNPRDAEVKALCAGLWQAGDVPSYVKINFKPDQKKALRYARELVQENPRQPDYLLLLALFHRGQHDYTGADAMMVRYLKIVPANAPHRRLALAYRQQFARDKRIYERMKREGKA